MCLYPTYSKAAHIIHVLQNWYNKMIHVQARPTTKHVIRAIHVQTRQTMKHVIRAKLSDISQFNMSILLYYEFVVSMKYGVYSVV